MRTAQYRLLINGLTFCGQVKFMFRISNYNLLFDLCVSKSHVRIRIQFWWNRSVFDFIYTWDRIDKLLLFLILRGFISRPLDAASFRAVTDLRISLSLSIILNSFSVTERDFFNDKFSVLYRKIDEKRIF